MSLAVTVRIANTTNALDASRRQRVTDRSRNVGRERIGKERGIDFANHLLTNGSARGNRRSTKSRRTMACSHENPDRPALDGIG